MIALEVRAGVSAGEVFRLDGDDARIGRDPGCEVRLQDEAVALQHARLLAAFLGPRAGGASPPA